MPRRLHEMQWLVSVSSVWHMAWCSSWSSSQIQLAHVAHCRRHSGLYVRLTTAAVSSGRIESGQTGS